jgi:septal ring factor EnvC (AmiA/AmiB activator)
VTAGRRLAACLALALLLAPWSPRTAAGREEPRSREEELIALRAEIKGLEARLEQARAARAGLEGELAAADLELRLEQRRLEEAGAARDAAAGRAAASERQLADLERRLGAARDGFRRRLIGLSRLGEQGYVRLFLLLKADRRFLPSVRLLRYLVRRDRESSDHYRQAQQAVAAERDRLLAQRREVEAWLERQEVRRAQLLTVRRRKAALLARAETERQSRAGPAAELNERERKLSGFLDLLYGRNAAGLAGASMQGFRGVLDWPVRGRVTQEFGFRLDPRYRTRVPHNGLSLATPAGGEVRAVYPGRVLFAAPFQGYGPTVVLLHPGRVFSLYAGLSDLRVSRGGMVSLGDAVGLASGELYFEIRVENRPEDPRSWLR